MNITVLPTRNSSWGFYGTSRHHADPDQAWALASTAIAEATGASLEGIRDFLDSRHGRHFADDVGNGLFVGMALPQAIEAAVTRWMGWHIGRSTSRETGIPAGLPYLTGFVTHFEVMADSEA
jgi:hypothetical protein